MVVIKIYKKNSPLARKKIFKEKFHFFLIFSITFSLVLISYSVNAILAEGKIKNKETLGISISKKADKSLNDSYPISANIIPTKIPTPPDLTHTPTPTISHAVILLAAPTLTLTPNVTVDNSQYTAKKIGDNTWQVTNIKNDNQMASSQEIFNALNSYRGIHGQNNLLWNGSLASFAQSRANTFASISNLDEHQGFKNFMNDNGFSKIGFNSLGENSAFLAGPMNGERIIKEIFGADSAHDGNQLDPSWQYVGAGVNGRAININFGKNKR